MDKDELRAWAILVRTSNAVYERVAAALQTTGSAQALIACSSATLERFGFSEISRRWLQQPNETLIDTDLDWLAAAPHRHLLPLTSPLYPALLAQSSGAPVAL